MAQDIAYVRRFLEGIRDERGMYRNTANRIGTALLLLLDCMASSDFLEEYRLSDGSVAVKLKDEYAGLFAEGFLTAGGRYPDQEDIQQGGGVLERDLTVNYVPNVGHVLGNVGRTYPAGTHLEDILRDILYKEQVASVTVSANNTQPQVDQQVTLTAYFDAGTSGLTVSSWQWYMDDAPVTGANANRPTYYYTPSDTTPHTFRVVVTLSNNTTMQSTSITITGQTQRATLTLTPSSREAEVGDTVTFAISYSPGTTGVASPTLTTSEAPEGTISGNTLTVQAREGSREVIVKAMNDNTELCKAKVTVTGYYKWFAGKVDAREMSQLSLGDIPTPTNYKFNGTSGNPYTFKIENYRQLAVAVPSEYTIKKIESLASHINLMNNSSEFLKTGTKVLAKSNKQYNVVLFTASRYTGDGVISEFEVSV